jgi:hypothetical protein
MFLIQHRQILWSFINVECTARLHFLTRPIFINLFIDKNGLSNKELGDIYLQRIPQKLYFQNMGIT